MLRGREESMKSLPRIFGILNLSLWLFIGLSVTQANDGPLYDSSAYTECKKYPERALYEGGILKEEDENPSAMVHLNGSIQNAGHRQRQSAGTVLYSPAFVLTNLTQGTKYCFSSWVKIHGAEFAPVKASLTTENTTYNCIATVLASSGCWSFLKGGFVLDHTSNTSLLYFKTTDGTTAVDISIASSSLQPFTDEEWRLNQEYRINVERKRPAIIHVSDTQGNKLQGAQISVEQISKDFPFGSAIAKTILGNASYQDWFVKRFNAAVFENELKWYATEPKPGEVNYTVPDQMLEFVRANQIVARGHNIFWEDPVYNPAWVRNLTSSQLQAAVTSRIQSLMSKYKEEFVHWDVSNEMLHFDFYEDKLGPNATLEFFEIAHQADPLSTLFMNDFNVVETCGDVNSTVDSYIRRLKQLKKGGARMEGIGLEGHFTVPNLPLMRAVLDKLSTLGLPIWLTEIDISKKIDEQTQAVYLEQVLREGFSHPYVTGIMLWTALHPTGCYQMCLTDGNLRNLPTGDVVDKLLQEWQTGKTTGETDEHGSYHFSGFLGEYNVNVKYGGKTMNATFSLCRSDETKHFNVQV